jgi:hypothetical protein
MTILKKRTFRQRRSNLFAPTELPPSCLLWLKSALWVGWFPELSCKILKVQREVVFRKYNQCFLYITFYHFYSFLFSHTPLFIYTFYPLYAHLFLVWKKWGTCLYLFICSQEDWQGIDFLLLYTYYKSTLILKSLSESDFRIVLQD